MDTYSEYAFFGALLLAGALLALGPIILPMIISPRSKGDKTTETYECGVDTIGSAWIRFDVAFYLFALIFVAFSVVVLYLLPVALVYDDGTYAWRDLVLVSLFVSIMSLALVYAWRQGVFHQLRKKPRLADPPAPQSTTP